jgi:hypothetical protein
MPPEVGMTTMMLDHQDAELVRKNAIVDSEGETSHRMATQVTFDDGPEAGRGLDLGNRRVELK